MGYYSVTDFNLPYPTWSRPLRRIRRGAMTAFVDKASGELVAGYSYSTCLFAVVESAEYPNGQLFENLTTYSTTTSGKHTYPLRRMIAEHLTDTYKYDWTGEADKGWVTTQLTCASAPTLEAIDVPMGTTAAELVVRCRMPLPVDIAVAARSAAVDAHNAAIDAGNGWPEHAGEAAAAEVTRPHWAKVRAACAQAELAEINHSRATYGDEYDKAARRRSRANARAEAKALAEREPIVEREPAAREPDVRKPAAQPGTFMLDGKLYGRA